MDIKEILAEVKRGCAEIIDEARIEDLIKNYYEKGENFYVKAGFDPTAPDLHLGHSVVLSKMAFLQKHGARVQFLIGDFTGQIGDPSGKNATRKKLSQEEVLKNAKTYESQVFKILDKNKTDIVFNSKWLNELGAAGIVELTSTFSVARMLEREDFTKRFREQSSISICEFLYPLLQGYDSVALKSDIEMGGTDQKFNLLMGRTLQRIYDVKKEQAIIMMPLLEGLDGVNKMSKSLNNYIGVTENAKDIYAKILSISDELMFRYYELLSKKSLKEIETIKENIQNGSLHPKIVKENLALELVERFHSKELANEAKAEFDRVHSANALPSEIAEFELSGGSVWLAKALVECGLENSTSAARRAIVANSVSVNSQKIKDEQMQLELGEYILQIGKRKFARLKVKK
ncbi:tyrosine--tRNA ligase [Campylobacter upsaliensis]|uniref:Tyrosine--tRNA ligase n=2 Tax=Campylobacter upsaliensis TaxID=28080 RepID=A0A828QW26_CAMUP|nr:tyrosine--tRNA ligase [Campylobacter upsaliensis]EAB5281718.1 tyrosine--tRNA ligase [Campylobacter upsaliensis]EAH4720438.1 tyrosine--tRNA ligase [Campylobacter upsaliensis]EAH5199495.1 tyrosine--tRNA ligase [Campylobacter upsaliensis]EAH5546714.1 tyrosine--tRNA ligase [Campylobacter upsaliensis]EAH5553144.1 tyrosine--tRNA ligase [Campylobacter upsaliensis]